MSKKEKCVPARTQGQKFLRSVVMVGVLNEKVLKGKHHTTLHQGGFIISFGPTGMRKKSEKLLKLPQRTS